MEKFEINSCKNWIELNQFHIVALQLPNEDLDKVQDLIDSLISAIEYDDIEFFLVGEGCSSCCNDLLNAQYCNAQGLIHFGHSCLSSEYENDNQPTIPIFYVFYQQPLPEDALKFLSTITDADNKPYYLVFYDPCYRNAIEQYPTTSSRIIFSKIQAETSTDPLNYTLYGRSVTLPVPLDPSNYSIICISSSKSSLNNFSLYFYAYEFHSFPTNTISSSKLLSKRIYGIESARNSSSFGLLLSSNSLLNLPLTLHKLLDYIKYLLDKNQRQYYTFLMNTISITKLNNFEKNIDIYIHCSSCPESPWFSPEFKQFNIPLVSINDLIHAFNTDGDDDTKTYSFDLNHILSRIKVDYDNEIDQQNDQSNTLVLKNPNALLLQQRERGVEQNRTWWGLQINKANDDDDDTEKDEKNSIAELKEGKSGIAAGYTNEKF